jgi:hypothetical protein
VIHLNCPVVGDPWSLETLKKAEDTRD